jgi:hypothetical protein
VFQQWTYTEINQLLLLSSSPPFPTPLLPLAHSSPPLPPPSPRTLNQPPSSSTASHIPYTIHHTLYSYTVHCTHYTAPKLFNSVVLYSYSVLILYSYTILVSPQALQQRRLELHSLYTALTHTIPHTPHIHTTISSNSVALTIHYTLYTVLIHCTLHSLYSPQALQ